MDDKELDDVNMNNNDIGASICSVLISVLVIFPIAFVVFGSIWLLLH